MCTTPSCLSTWGGFLKLSNAKDYRVFHNWDVHFLQGISLRMCFSCFWVKAWPVPAGFFSARNVGDPPDPEISRGVALTFSPAATRTQAPDGRERDGRIDQAATERRAWSTDTCAIDLRRLASDWHGMSGGIMREVDRAIGALSTIVLGVGILVVRSRAADTTE
jgi:hypothetical protein